MKKKKISELINFFVKKNYRVIEYKILNLNKLIFFAEKNKKKKIFKIGYDNIGKKFINNELKAYSKIHEYNKIFLLPKINYIKPDNNNLSILKLDYLGNKKGTYLDIKKFININEYKKKKYKLFSTKKYISKIIENHNNEAIKYKSLIKNLLRYIKYSNLIKIPTSISHGDFIHWNTLFYKNKGYVIDLEYMNKNRIIYFDIVHWLFLPVVQKLYTFKINSELIYKFLLNIVVVLIFFYIKIFIDKKISKIFFKSLLIFYLFEKILLFEKIIKTSIKKRIMTDKAYLTRTKFHKNIYKKILLSYL